MKVPKPKKMSSGTYFIQLRLNGISIPITASTAKECTRQAELIKAEHRSGVRSVSARKSMTLDRAIEAYIDSRRAVLSPSTINGYETIRRTRFLSYMEDRISEIDWQAAINKESKLCSPKTLKNAYGLMVSVLAYCGIQKPSTKLPQVTPSDKAWLEPEQIPVFVEAVKDEPFAIPALLALHGLRRSEIYGLTWDSIDLKRYTISVVSSVVLDENGEYVRKAQMKNATNRRTVPIMIPALIELLTECRQLNLPIVKGTPNALYKQVNRVCKRCGLPEVGVHGLRHSFASLGYHLGIPEREMMELGGWSDTTTMHKIYTHVAQADRLKSKGKLLTFFANSEKNANKMLSDFEKPL